MKFIVLVLFFSINFKCFAAYNLNYSIKDLQILAKENEYKEFFAHFKDVKPSERDAYWRKLVDEVSISFLQNIDSKPKITKTDIDNIDQLFSHPVISKNEKFKNLRLKIGLKYFDKLFSENNTNNADELLQFWLKETSFADYAYQFGLLSTKINASIDTQWHFYSKAFNGAQSHRYCNTEHAAQIIIQKLTQVTGTDTFSDPDQFLDKLINQDCKQALSPFIKDYFFQANTNLRPIIYELLYSKSSSIDQDLISFYYILSGPVVSKAFNHSWNKLSEIKNDSTRRENLLKALKDKDTLPDGLFSLLDQEKKNLLIQFVYKNIPEYFDLYATTCISYLKGEKIYAKGNPTLHCQDLFDYTERVNSELVNDLLKFQYKQAKKF